MKIYFAGSIRAGRAHAEIYAMIIDWLGGYGEVLTEHFKHADVQSLEVHLTDKEIHDRDMDWIRECDVVVAEVTQPSLGVGYELGRAAFELGKPVLALYHGEDGKRLSAMIAGCDQIKVVHYGVIKDARIAISDYFRELDE